MPAWLKIALAFLVMAILYSLARLPHSVSAMFHLKQHASQPSGQMVPRPHVEVGEKP